MGTDFPKAAQRYPEWQSFLERIKHVAPSNAPVLIVGEPDSDRESVARAVHKLRPRHHAPFVPIHCARLKPNELERVLFGNESDIIGTIAKADDNLIIAADGGTLFLDRIEACSGPLQLRLSRLLDQGWSYERKHNGTLTVNLRLIVGTGSDLQARVLAGQFLDDLFYRINGITLRIPPLPQRLEDTP